MKSMDEVANNLAEHTVKANWQRMLPVLLNKNVAALVLFSQVTDQYNFCKWYCLLIPPNG